MLPSVTINIFNGDYTIIFTANSYRSKMYMGMSKLVCNDKIAAKLYMLRGAQLPDPFYEYRFYCVTVPMTESCWKGQGSIPLPIPVP